jgi:hypothetical protein
MYILIGVAEKHDFRGIQRKIPQISDFAKNRDSNPPSHGDTAADIAKMFAKFFLRISDFGLKNTIFAKIRSDFCEIPQTISRKSDSAKNFFHDFRNFSATLRFSQKIIPIVSAKIGFRGQLSSQCSRPVQKRRFLQYNSQKCQSKTIFFKLCRIGPLPLGAIVPNLQKNQTTLVAKIIISGQFSNFREKLL